MNEIEIPPIGGEKVPLKELKPREISKEQKVETGEEKPKVVRRYPMLVLGSLFLIIIGIVFGVFLGQVFKKPLPTPAPLPTALPTPSLTATPSVSLKDYEEKLNQFEKNLKSADLKEESLTPPILDYKLKFTVRD